MILLIEDEPGIVDFVRRGLEAEGFPVEAALDGLGGRAPRAAGELRPDRARPDAPRPWGLEILGALRQAKLSCPVIVLTARGEIEDRVGGLDAGAVDYLVKPFSLAELAARVRAQLRLAAQSTQASLLVAATSRSTSSPARCAAPGEPVRLSSTEFDLLVHLIRNRGRVLTREQILSSACGATSTTPGPTSSTSTSATCGASSAPPRTPRRS